MQPPRSKARVALVLERDEDARHLASALLEETDLCVEEIASSEDALAFLRGNADDVALLMADAEAVGDGACGRLASTISGCWPWISVLITARNPTALARDLPDGATLMPKPWLALDVLVEAEKATRSARP